MNPDEEKSVDERLRALISDRLNNKLEKATEAEKRELLIDYDTMMAGTEAEKKELLRFFEQKIREEKIELDAYDAVEESLLRNRKISPREPTDPFKPHKVQLLEHVAEMRMGTYKGDFVRKCRIIEDGIFDLFIASVDDTRGIAAFVSSPKGEPNPKIPTLILSGSWKEETKWRKKMSKPGAPISGLLLQKWDIKEIEGMSLVFSGDYSEEKTMARHARQRLAAYKTGGSLNAKTKGAALENIGEMWAKPLIVRW
ncbi:hypothetical protein N9D40_01010 [bacterium]|nr:hypothetical protein [bacterium]